MRNLGWLFVALVLATGCKKKEEKAPPAPAPASGSVVAQPDPGSGSAPAPAVGSGSGSGASESGYKMTKETDEARPETSGFKGLDERIAGTTPWLSDQEAKAGFVEHTDKGVKRLCGEDAKKAISQYAEFAKKLAADKSYEQTVCRDNDPDADSSHVLCLTDAHDGDMVLLLDFARAKTTSLVGVHFNKAGSYDEKQSAEYEKLLATKCK